jgi:DNA modification methylase
MKLFDRVLLPFTDENDLIIDPFMGSGSVGRWCINNKRDYIGIEYNTSVYNIAVSTFDSGGSKDPGF